MYRWSNDQRRARIGERHFLSLTCRTDDLSRLVDGIVGLHSSDPATVYLSAAVRMRHPSIGAIERALYDDRSLVRLHGFRNTMWVMTPDTARAMHACATRQRAGALTQRLETAVAANDITDDPVAWVADAKRKLIAALHRRGTATTRELGSDVPEVAIPLAIPGGQVSAHSRLMTSLGFDGAVLRGRPLGTWISSQYTWTVADDWIDGGLGEGPAEQGAASIVERYLHAFGPVTLSDLVWWTGWTKTFTRAALDAAATATVEIEDDSSAGEPAYTLSGDDGPPARSEAWVALLPGLDPTTMGWKHRSWYLDPEHVPALFDRNGNAGPTVWVDGRVVGGWAQRPDGSIAYRLLDRKSLDRRDAIDDAIHRLREIYGDIRHRVRFPVPIQTELLD